jgi:hypothetical protein
VQCVWVKVVLQHTRVADRVCELCAPHPLCHCVGSLLLPRTPRGARIREGNVAVPIPRTHAPHRGQGLAGTVRHTCVAKGKAMTEMACAFFCAPPAPQHTPHPGQRGGWWRRGW